MTKPSAPAKPMTVTQITYAVKRVTEIRDAKIKNFISALPPLPKLPEPRKYSDDEKQQMIREGKATLRDDVHRYSALINAFDYPQPKETSEEKRLRIQHKVQKEINDKKLAEYDAKLRVEYQSLLDQIHLGDAPSALSLIEAFAAK